MIVRFIGVTQSLVDGIQVLVAEGHPEFVIQVVGEELQSQIKVTKGSY